MNFKGYKGWIAMAFSVLLLAACNVEETTDKDSNVTEDTKKEVAKDKAGNTFPTKTSNSAAAIEGGHLNYGLVTDSPFEGLLNWTFSQSTYDADILRVFDEAL